MYIIRRKFRPVKQIQYPSFSILCSIYMQYIMYFNYNYRKVFCRILVLKQTCGFRELMFYWIHRGLQVLNGAQEFIVFSSLMATLTFLMKKSTKIRKKKKLRILVKYAIHTSCPQVNLKTDRNTQLETLLNIYFPEKNNI